MCPTVTENDRTTFELGSMRNHLGSFSVVTAHLVCLLSICIYWSSVDLCLIFYIIQKTETFYFCYFQKKHYLYEGPVYNPFSDGPFYHNKNIWYLDDFSYLWGLLLLPKPQSRSVLSQMTQHWLGAGSTHPLVLIWPLMVQVSFCILSWHFQNPEIE